MLKIAYFFLIVAALSQQRDEAVELQRDKCAAQACPSYMDMISVRAIHADGTSAKGSISCDGLWQKYDEHPTSGWNLPFVTDSRGVAIFNPWVNTYDDDVMTCRALDVHGHRGSASWAMPTSTAEITVR